MPQASILVKPASANCNMDCKYCFYKCLSINREKYSLGFMSGTTLELLVKNAIDYAEDYLTFAFQGGEPTLAGIDFFKKAVKFQKLYRKEKPTLRIENTIQTNGTTLTDEWCEFLHKENFLVGISIDGPRKNHDLARKMSGGNDSFEKVMQGVALLKKHKVDFNVLTVITEQLSEKASSLYKFYKRNGFNYVQLIPCMDEAGRQAAGNDELATKNSYAVKPKSYGRFLCEFFDLWYEDFKRGDIMDVRMFSNLAQMTIGYQPEECGMCGQCNCYFVVEGDGSIYPCDFYCMDAYKLGTVSESFSTLKNSKIAVDFEKSSVQKAKECLECEYYSLCRGGCRRFREHKENQIAINYLCEGYKIFFRHTNDRLKKLGQTIINPAARRLL